MLTASLHYDSWNFTFYPAVGFLAALPGMMVQTTFRQFAYVYSQSLPSGFELERSCFSAVEVGNLQQGILFQCLELRVHEALRRLVMQCELSCLRPCKDAACGNIAMKAVSLVRLGACRIAVQAV